MAQFAETSMGAIFQNRVQQYGDKTLVLFKNKQKIWEEISWNRTDRLMAGIPTTIATVSAAKARIRHL